MALPRLRELQKPDSPPPLELAAASDRAGAYTMQQLELLLKPVLAAPEEKAVVAWPSAAAWAFVLGSSLALWAAIVFVITRLI